jgi:hypothetical protein
MPKKAMAIWYVCGSVALLAFLVGMPLALGSFQQPADALPFCVLFLTAVAILVHGYFRLRRL